MPEPLSPDQLDQLEALNEKRTPGPWEISWPGTAIFRAGREHALDRLIAGMYDAGEGGIVKKADAAFIAALANAAPALLAAARQHQHTEADIEKWRACRERTNACHDEFGWGQEGYEACSEYQQWEDSAADDLLARAGEGGSSE